MVLKQFIQVARKVWGLCLALVYLGKEYLFESKDITRIQQDEQSVFNRKFYQLFDLT